MKRSSFYQQAFLQLQEMLQRAGHGSRGAVAGSLAL
jgi:hypothetical protein